ncbi:MAG TPA: protoporphyrinogen oxidase [Rhabdochlamydiaceae bacterium]|nr:protoporphyrinogen oxidase [Rhabdochlamydiaceae bacterium]
MKKKRVLILGAGISGLSLAWYLKQSVKDIEISIVEKTNHVGGWIRTDTSTGYLFETGPHIFKTSRCPELLQLAVELGLEQEIISSDPQSQARYLWVEGRLRKINPLLTKGLIPALLKEWCIPVQCASDESVWDFIRRRFNSDVAEKLIEPVLLGIYAGDIRSLSAQACLPTLKKWEKNYGSLTKGFFSEMIRQKNNHLPLKGLFSFRGGMQQLVQSLTDKLSVKIHLDQEVESIRCKGAESEVNTVQGEVFCAEHIFSTLPAHVMKPLFQSDAHLSSMFSEIKANEITVVNLGYSSDVLGKKGFGYLVPSSQQEDILGTIFDSSVFPQQNQRKSETRLTVMMRRETTIDHVTKKIEQHLGITSSPDVAVINRLVHAIPQYHVGHLERIEGIETRLQNTFPQMTWLGNCLSGVSVNDCITKSKKTAQNFIYKG